jgi:hypothetical protein
MATSVKPALVRIRARVKTALGGTRASARKDLKAKTVNSVSPSAGTHLQMVGKRGNAEIPKAATVMMSHLESLCSAALSHCAKSQNTTAPVCPPDPQGGVGVGGIGFCAAPRAVTHYCASREVECIALTHAPWVIINHLLFYTNINGEYLRLPSYNVMTYLYK